MPGMKVVSLRQEPIPAPNNSGRQSDLFGEAQPAGRYFCLLNINDLNEDRLLSIVVRHTVHTIVDLRQLPVFERPRFNHRHLMSYFRDHKVLYLEYAVALRNPEMFSALHREDNEPLGLSLWIYDESTVSVGWYDHVRKSLKSTPLFDAEVPARTLMRSL